MCQDSELNELRKTIELLKKQNAVAQAAINGVINTPELSCKSERTGEAEKIINKSTLKEMCHNQIQQTHWSFKCAKWASIVPFNVLKLLFYFKGIVNPKMSNLSFMCRCFSEVVVFWLVDDVLVSFAAFYINGTLDVD